jgi:hypothetical protein
VTERAPKGPRSSAGYPPPTDVRSLSEGYLITAPNAGAEAARARRQTGGARKPSRRMESEYARLAAFVTATRVSDEYGEYDDAGGAETVEGFALDAEIFLALGRTSLREVTRQC